MKTNKRFTNVSLIFLVASIFLLSCAVNPVTGKREFMLMSEQDEIVMGRETDKQIGEMYGFYDDPALNAYVSQIGIEMGKLTHRPNLNYSFKVLDTPVVNAFAVPGGYIYVTRGILAYFNNEAELAGVIGHELGHVNARHSAKSYSRAQLAGLGLGIGMILWEDMQKYAGVIQFGVGMMFLKFSRSDEHQADALGVEYSSKSRYDSQKMSDFFHTLERLNPGASHGGLPGWFSTHPNPANRIENINMNSLKWQEKLLLENPKVARNEYLLKLEGLVYGEDPRQGYIEENAFYHPQMKFQFPIPAEWQVMNTPKAVQILSPNQDAAIILTLAQGATVREASQNFANEIKGESRSAESLVVNGLNARKVITDLFTEQDSIRIQSYFIQKKQQIYVFHGYASKNNFTKFKPSFNRTMRQFKRLTDSSKINVKPNNLLLKRVPRAGTLQQIFDQFGIPKDQQEQMAILNGFQLSDNILKGTRLKVIQKK